MTSDRDLPPAKAGATSPASEAESRPRAQPPAPPPPIPVRLWRLLRSRPEFATSPLLLVLVLVVWQYGSRAAGIPTYVLPLPSEILSELFGQLGSATFWKNYRVTAVEAMLGFVLGSTVALVLGTIIALVRLAEATLMPYIVALQSVPKIALAPLFLIWFGFGMTSKVVVAAVIVFFPMLVNTIEGLRSADQDMVEMVRAFSGSKRQVFFRVRVPCALPFVFAGLDIAVVFSILGAIVGEFLGAKAGLGAQLLQANYNFDTAQLFSVLIVMSMSGLLLHTVVRTVQRKVVFWVTDRSTAAMP